MNKPNKLSTTVQLTWHLFTNCPHCYRLIDLSDGPYDDDGAFSVPIFNNKWETLNGEEIECKHCKKTFVISEIEY